MSTIALWIIGIIAFLIMFGSFILLDIRINKNIKKCIEPEIDNKLYYAADCINCGLEFDFGDYDIKMYIDKDGKKHQITQCPRCKTYINIDP